MEIPPYCIKGCRDRNPQCALSGSACRERVTSFFATLDHTAHARKGWDATAPISSSGFLEDHVAFFDEPSN